MAKIEYPVVQPPRIDFPQPYVHREPLIDSRLLDSYWQRRSSMNQDTEKRAEGIFSVIAKDDFVPTNSIYLFKNFGVLHDVNEYGRKKLVEAEDRITNIARTVSEKGPSSYFWANTEMKKLSQALNRDVSGGNYKKAENFGKALAEANSTLEKSNLQADEIYRAVNRLETILKGFDEKNKRFSIEAYEEKTGKIPGLQELSFTRELASPFDVAGHAASHVQSSKTETDQGGYMARETLYGMGIDPEDEEYLTNVSSESRDVREAVRQALENHPEAVLRTILTARASSLIKELEDKMNADLPPEKRVKLMSFNEEEYVKRLQDKGKIGEAMASIYNFYRTSQTVKGNLGSKRRKREEFDIDPSEVGSVKTIDLGPESPGKNKVFFSGKAKDSFSEGFGHLSSQGERKIIVSDEEGGLRKLSTTKNIDETFGIQLEGQSNFSLTMGGLKIGKDESRYSSYLSLKDVIKDYAKFSNPELDEDEREELRPLVIQAYNQMDYAVEKYAKKALEIERVYKSGTRPLTETEVEFHNVMERVTEIYRNALMAQRKLPKYQALQIAPYLSLETEKEESNNQPETE